MKLVSTAEAAKETGLSEWELRDGFKKGRYPALLIGKADKAPRLRWDIDLLSDAIKEQMYKSMSENQECPIDEELE